MHKESQKGTNLNKNPKPQTLNCLGFHVSLGTANICTWPSKASNMIAPNPSQCSTSQLFHLYESGSKLLKGLYRGLYIGVLQGFNR